jgi:hypothetical protein
VIVDARWHAVKRVGRFVLANADTLGSLAIAMFLALISVAGNATFEDLGTGILAVLTLLSFSALRDRLQRDQVLTVTRRLSTELSSVAQAITGTRRIHVSRDQEANNDHLTALIRGLPNITAARFLAFSGRDARLFVEQVLEHSDCAVQLLVKHPESVGPVQQRWILAELDRLQRYAMARHGGRLQVRCYRQPYSLRGRKLEPHLVDVGWYTPRPGDPVEVVGHRNPLVTVRLDSEEGVAIARMFDEVFEALWGAPDSEDVARIANI